jgi:hypothetical protein
VLPVTIEFSKRVHQRELPVGAHQLVALLRDPRGNRLMVAFPAADQRGAKIEMPRAPCGRRGEHVRQQFLQCAGRKRGDRLVRVGMMLDAEPGVEQPEVLRDLRDRRDRGFAGAARHPLLDRDRGRNSGEPVDGGAGQLLNELPRVRRHRLHEPPLALGKNDVEGERRLPRAGDAGDDVELSVRNRQREILQVVLAGAFDAERGRAVARQFWVWSLVFGVAGRF